MKSSICKQEGHNKRSCKTMTTPVSAPKILETNTMDYSKKTRKELIALCREMGYKGYSRMNKAALVDMLSSTTTTTTPVSAPKIEAETDVKATAAVKLEMTSYTSIIQSALDTESVAPSLIESYEGCSIQELLDKLSKSRAAQSVAIASLVAKIHHPDEDTRLHEVQLGGKRSLRTISKTLNEFLHLKCLIPAKTDYACLSPAFKGVSAPFDMKFTGSIKPKEALPALLTLLKYINTIATPEIIKRMLIYILATLKEIKKKNDVLSASTVECMNTFSLQDVTNTLDKLHNLGAGSSKLPVIVVFTLMSIVQPYKWPTLRVAPLKEHTEADKDHSCGDIEAFDSSSAPKIVIEVKHNIAIDESIIFTFNKKTKDKDVPLKYILSTVKTTVNRFVGEDISINTVDIFVTTNLQDLKLHDKNICATFLQRLRTNIVEHTNLSLAIKEAANKILTELLVSPSL